MKYIQENPDEIIAFKKYLEEYYQLNYFSEFETIWGTHEQNDPVIRKFCTENRIISIVKLPEDKSSHFYDRHGNVVQLYFNRASMIERVQSIIFDYTEKGFAAYDEKYEEAKVADGIYIFD